MLFISHSGEDRDVTERIVAFLEDRGLKCWFSSRDISPQSVYAEAITEAVRACSSCLVLLSESANGSAGVKREVELASHYKKPFITVRIDDSEIAPGLDYYLRNVQWLDYHRQGDRVLERIVSHLTKRDAPEPPATAVSPTAAAPVNPSAKPQRTGAPVPPRGGPSPGIWVGGGIAAVVALLALLWSLGSGTREPETYPPDIARNFMIACEAQGSTNALCGCTWQKIELNISPSDFASLERLPARQRETHPLTAQINGYVEACAVDLAPPPDPTVEYTAPEP